MIIMNIHSKHSVFLQVTTLEVVINSSYDVKLVYKVGHSYLGKELIEAYKL